MGRANALHRAVLSDDWSKVEHLLRWNSLLVNEVDERDMTPLHYAAKRAAAGENKCLQLINHATQATLNLLYPLSWGRHSLLHSFALRGFSHCFSCILQETGKRINKQDTDGQTPLHWCAQANLTLVNHLDIVLTLLKVRANTTIKDKLGKSAAEIYKNNECGLYEKETKEADKYRLGCLLRGEVPHQILSNGYDAVMIYLKALKKGSEQSKKCNLVVVGQARAGKTSLIKRLTGQSFNAKEKETDGIVTTSTCEIDEHSDEWSIETTESIGKTKTSKGLRLKIFDFAGQEIYYTTHQVFIMSRAVFTLVFDLTLDLSAKALVEVGKDHRLKDLPRWIVKVATFLKRTKNVEVYELDMTNLDFINYWLCSIYAHTEENIQEYGTQAKQLSPAIFIVGTHKNSLPGNHSQRKAKVDEIFDVVYQSLKRKPFLKHVVTKYYAVDSSTWIKDRDIHKLQRHIMEVIKEEPYMNERLPVTWIGMELMLEQKRHDMNLMEMWEVRNLASKCGVDDSEVSTILQFQHDSGNCVYFENRANADDPLNCYIILNQMWLNEIFRCVITIKPTEFAQFSESWDRLANEGLLDEKLARHVWGDYQIDPNVLFNIMDRFDLLCEMQFSTEESARRLAEGTRVFCLPCCLSERIEGPTVTENDNCTMRLFVDFAGFLPCGLFMRLMVRTIRFSQESGGRDQRLSRHSAEFYVDPDHHLVLRIFSKDRSFMEVIIVRVAGDGNPSPAVCQMVYEFLRAALRDLRNIWSKGIKFTFGVPCDQCQGETEKLHLHTFDECTQASGVSCKGRRMKTKKFRSLFVKGLDHVYVQETKNFQIMLSLVTDLGTNQMRNYFLRQTNIDKADVGQFLIQEQTKGSFKRVRVFAEQKQKMFTTDADIDDFDITIMMMLIRQCCGISCPSNFWTDPDEQDHSELANLVRIREYRNKLAHNQSNRISTTEFEQEWSKLTAIFQNFGVDAEDIDKYRQIAL